MVAVDLVLICERKIDAIQQACASDSVFWLYGHKYPAPGILVDYSGFQFNNLGYL